MDDITALWLLSALLQSMATIWGLFFIIAFFFYKRFSDWGFPNGYEKQAKGLMVILILFNNSIALAIGFSIGGLLDFRNDSLIYLSVIFSVLSVILISAFILVLLCSLYFKIGKQKQKINQNLQR